MMTSTAPSPLRVIPLGGLGEVGMNLMVFECGDEMILVDCGLLFPDLSWLGLDFVLPDFTYIVENKHKLKGVVVTHAHEDHIGAIPFLLKEVDVPIIYGGAFARKLLEDKCEEHGILKKLLFYDVNPGDKVPMGSFEVEFVHVTHSTVQTFALAIRTPQGLVIHSGDFKFDETPYAGPPSDKKRLRELGDEKPILVLSDSTNSLNHGHTESERKITSSLLTLVEEAPELVVVALFASNIHRIQQLVDIAKKMGRKIFLSGRSMERYVEAALELGLLNLPGDLLFPLQDISNFPRNQCLVLSTGSQAQARSSLQQLAHNESRWVKIRPRDTVILSSRNIPGNEKAVHALVNDFYRMGAEVFYAEMAQVHVSGHAAKDEQIEFLALTSPECFIPIHGEPRQMIIHNRTAQESGYIRGSVFYLENGSVWEYDRSQNPRARVLEEKVPIGKLWVFQDEIGSFEEDRLKERKTMARAGVIALSLQVNPSTQELLKKPVVELKGFLGTAREREELRAQLTAEAESSWVNFRPDGTFLSPQEAVAGQCRKIFRKLFNLKPLVIVQILQ